MTRHAQGSRNLLPEKGARPKRARRPKHRIAVVDLPELPLQLLLRDHPRWANAAVAVVEAPGPEGRVTHVNARAFRSRIRPGMRQATARHLAPELRIGVISEARVSQMGEEIAKALQTFSPKVEAHRELSRAFFLDPSGLFRLYGGTPTWARAVHQFLAGRRLESTVVLGFERFRALAVARTHRRVVVLASRSEEQARAERVPLTRFGIPPRLHEGLMQLGVRTLGDLLALPAGELASRFGPEAGRLHGLFATEPQLPIQPRPFDEPVAITLSVEPPDANHERLLFAIKGALHELLRALSVRRESLHTLRLTLTLDGAGAHHEQISPASPTRDVLSIMELVRLRLGSVRLDAPVEAISLEAEPAAPDAQQLGLGGLGGGSKNLRDPSGAGFARSAERALARVRAAFGPMSVARARLRDAHLPEARFAWEPVDTVRAPHALGPSQAEHPSLVRQVLARPRGLSPLSRADPEAGPRIPESEGTLTRLYGPYRVSGAWWVREVERDYYYAETSSGALLWLYYDRPRKRWFWHGTVD